jgi:catechol 2,3-dioxygenase-like lactoylglutathione lyase family enzyme
MAGWKV